MKKLFFTLTILFFISCSDNEENIDATTSDFVGTWNLTTFDIDSSTKVSYSGFSYTLDSKTFGKDFDFTFTFSETPNEYTTNGEYTLVTEYNDPYSGETESYEYPVTALESFSSGSWSIVDNKLIIENGFQQQEIDLNIDTDFENQLSGITVKSLSSNKIILEEKISQDLTQTFDGEDYSYEIDINYTVVLEK